MRELEIKSRQTIVKWEASDEIPRLLELAMKAIDELPDARKGGVLGEKMNENEAARHREAAIRISETENLAKPKNRLHRSATE